MSALPDGQNTPPNSPENGQKVTPNDKEYNFAQIRQQLEREKQEKNQLKEEVEKLKKMNSENLGGDDDDYDEPYIDRKRLRKELGKVVEQTKAETDTKIEHMVTKALSEERKQAWLKEHPDFEEVVQHAQKVEDHDPDLAKMILRMPDEFDRYKMVYKHLKATGLHKPPAPKESIQEKVDANRRSPYYQPSGVAAAPYNNTGDFSDSGKKNAWLKMQELITKRRA